LSAPKRKKKIKRQQAQNREYQQLAKQHRPPVPVLRNVAVAWVVGGLICVIGQALMNMYIKLGFKPEQAGGPTAATLIFVTALLTGLGVFDKLGQFAGAGTAVPVTGFANSVVSAAMEFKREGLVLGVGAKMFALAGPVIVYGAVTAFFIGVIKAILEYVG
jgi:stage V sporulation protein AC